MFKSLKSKLKGWLGKSEEEPEGEKVSEKHVKKAEKKLVKPAKKSKEKSAKKVEKAKKKSVKPKKSGSDGKSDKGVSELVKPKSKSGPGTSAKKSGSDELPSDSDLKKAADKIEGEVPQKYDVASHAFKPDTDKVKEDIVEKSDKSVVSGEPSKNVASESESVGVSDKSDDELSDSSSEGKPKKGFLKGLFKKKPSEVVEPVVSDDDEKSVESDEEKVVSDESVKPEGSVSSKPVEPVKPKSSIFSRVLSGKSVISKGDVEELFEPLELILLQNNVALEVVDRIREKLVSDLSGFEVKKSGFEDKVSDSLRTAIGEVLVDSPDLVSEIKDHKRSSPNKPFVIVFFGINGTGKTTSIAKLAHKLKSEGLSVALAAADTFRAASIEQLQVHADRLGVPMIKQDYGVDPTAVAFDAKRFAEKNRIDCLLVDTAGRMYTKENLIKQMEKLIRVISPERKVFVGESITGNDAIEQARTFNDAVGIDGIILSKADVDEKGGTPLSVTFVTGRPIYFLGVGQGYDDLEPFSKSKILKNLGFE